MKNDNELALKEIRRYRESGMLNGDRPLERSLIAAEQALEGLLPRALTEDELRKMDGKPVYMYDLEQNRGMWDILTWDDDGNMYFVCQWLAHEDAIHSMILEKVKSGKRVLYRQEIPGTEVVETMFPNQN